MPSDKYRPYHVSDFLHVSTRVQASRGVEQTPVDDCGADLGGGRYCTRPIPCDRPGHAEQ